MRSKWKLSLIQYGDSTSSFNHKLLRAPKILLGPNLVNNRVEVYNGKKMLSIIVRDYMVGRRISNFVSSKYTGKVIHVKRKKRIKSK